MGGYRLFPLALKEYESYTAKTLEEMIIKERVWDKARYTDDDSYYFTKLKDNGLALSDEEKCLKYIFRNVIIEKMLDYSKPKAAFWQSRRK